MSGPKMVSEREAGRALDAEVAERVMGESLDWWDALVLDENGDARCGIGRTRSCADVEETVRKYAERYPGIKAYARVRAYSTDIAAAWLVVEKMRAGGYHVTLTVSALGDEAQPYCCEIETIARDNYECEHGETPALAICLAALASLPVSGEPPK